MCVCVYLVLEAEVRKEAHSREHQLSHTGDACERVLDDQGHDATNTHTYTRTGTHTHKEEQRSEQTHAGDGKYKFLINANHMYDV